MKKILLGFLLILALIAVSYYSAVRTDTRVKREYTSGYSKGEKEAMIQKSRADSLESNLRQTRSQYEDSLRILALAHDVIIDSLNRTISTKDKELAARANARKTQTAKKTDTGTRKASVTKSGFTHAQILDFYRTKLKALPADLSAYERRVALNEIRDETTRKFAITAKDFDSIREVNKLTE